MKNINRIELIRRKKDSLKRYQVYSNKEESEFIDESYREYKESMKAKELKPVSISKWMLHHVIRGLAGR